MKESKPQKEFRLAMNDLIATDHNKKHLIEAKNDYKDYPCACGATDNQLGSTCWRYKAEKIKQKFYPLIQINL